MTNLLYNWVNFHGSKWPKFSKTIWSHCNLKNYPVKTITDDDVDEYSDEAAAASNDDLKRRYPNDRGVRNARYGRYENDETEEDDSDDDYDDDDEDDDDDDQNDRGPNRSPKRDFRVRLAGAGGMSFNKDGPMPKAHENRLDLLANNFEKQQQQAAVEGGSSYFSRTSTGSQLVTTSISSRVESGADSVEAGPFLVGPPESDLYGDLSTKSVVSSNNDYLQEPILY